MEEKGILLCPIEYQTRTENLQECGDKIDNKKFEPFDDENASRVKSWSFIFFCYT